MTENKYLKILEKQDNKKNYFIFGLGNPEEQYKNTRHNIGFDFLNLLKEHLEKKNSLSFVLKKSPKLKSKIYKSSISGSEQVLLIFPETYMNNSGESVVAVLNWYKTIPSNNQVLIVYDEISLELGSIRWSSNRGAGGHHGIESIIRSLNSKDFLRLRIGVGPDPGGLKRASYVLSRFKKNEEEKLKLALTLALESTCKFLRNEDLSKIMNTYN